MTSRRCSRRERIEAAFGLIVVPPVHGEQALRNLVSGLVGVLSAKVMGA
jgi:hypothetical protein